MKPGTRWQVIDGDYDSLEVQDMDGNLVCNPWGDTLGEIVDRSVLIAGAPECRELLEQTLDELDPQGELAVRIQEFLRKV